MSYQIRLRDGNLLIPKTWWHIPDDLTNAISLKEASVTYHYSRSAILRKIKKNEIYGFKMNHRWYLLPHGLKMRYHVD